MASPATSPAPGQTVSLSYVAANATGIRITATGISPITGTLAGPVSVTPQQNTTYTITATGAQGTTPATCTVAVVVTQPEPPRAIIAGPQVIDTIYRETVLDASPSVNPAGGPLTYFWEPLETGAAVLDQGQVRTRVQIAGLAGDYRFRLTVRNAAGQSGSAIVTVRFTRTTLF
jgi:hypothetical protein